MLCAVSEGPQSLLRVSSSLHCKSWVAFIFLVKSIFCQNVEYGLYMLGELMHRKHVCSEVRLWDENQRDFSRAVKMTQLSYNSNFSFQNLEAINTSDVLF